MKLKKPYPLVDILFYDYKVIFSGNSNPYYHGYLVRQGNGTVASVLYDYSGNLLMINEIKLPIIKTNLEMYGKEGFKLKLS